MSLPDIAWRRLLPLPFEVGCFLRLGPTIVRFSFQYSRIIESLEESLPDAGSTLLDRKTENSAQTFRKLPRIIGRV